MDKQHHIPIVRVLAVIALSVLSLAPAQAQFGGGSGTETDPYIIATTDHMTALADSVNSGSLYYKRYFSLVNDLDFAGKTYKIIGGDRGAFAGIFNGGGHTIRNATIERPSNPGDQIGIHMYVGLFGRLNGVVKNLTLSASTVRGGLGVGAIVGCLAGRVGGDWSTLEFPPSVLNCHVTSDVTIQTVSLSSQFTDRTPLRIGSVVGDTEGNAVVIRNCTSAATVTGLSSAKCVGGIVGFLYAKVEFELSQCAFTGTLTGASYVGGIVGCKEVDNGYCSMNYIGGACTIGAYGVEGSTQGQDGNGTSRIYTVNFDGATQTSGTVETQPFITVSGTGYYRPDSTIVISNLSTGSSLAAGQTWTYRAKKNATDYKEVLPNGDDTWQFTMPAGNVTVTRASAVKDIATATVTFTPESMPVGEIIIFYKPQFTVVVNGRSLVENTDFTTDIDRLGMFPDAGVHPIRIRGMGEYGGAQVVYFTVKPRSLEDNNGYSPIPRIALYTGSGHRPKIDINFSSLAADNPQEGKDFVTDIPEGGFTDVGDYTITITGINNYTGVLQTTFSIVKPWEGDGTQANPYLISTTDQFDALASLTNVGTDMSGLHFRQTADLDYTGKTFTPVGRGVPFKGIYDGLGKSISGVNLIGNTSYVGIFARVGEGGEVHNVIVADTCSFSGGRYTGAIVGRNEGRVSACSVASTNVIVKGNNFVGGIVGQNSASGTVEANECKASVSLSDNSSSERALGGIVGANSGTVYGIFSGTVSGTSIVGGVVGHNKGDNAEVSGANHGEIIATSGIAGGIVGKNESGATVSQSLNTCLMQQVSGTTDAGAIIGQDAGGTASHNYYIGDCLYKGINNADVLGQAMRGIPISHDESIGFFSMPDAAGSIVGTYYDDGTNNHYYAGEGETLRFVLMGGTGYTANGSPLAIAGHDDDYDEDYYELTMPAQPVHIAPVGLTLTLYDNWINANNEDYIADADGQVREVTIKGRTLYKDGNWNTVFLPFSLDSLTGTPFEGATVMELDAAGRNGLDPWTGTLHLTFKSTASIAAGRPYVVKWDSGTDISDPVFAGVTIDASPLVPVTLQSSGHSAVTFKGSYGFTWVSAGDKTQLFLTPGNQLRYADEERRLLPFRAWFSVDESTSQYIRGFSLDFGDVQTSLSALETDSRPSPIHDLQGRRVTAPRKGGIYIVNGKKLIY